MISIGEAIGSPVDSFCHLAYHSAAWFRGLAGVRFLVLLACVPDRSAWAQVTSANGAAIEVPRIDAGIDVDGSIEDAGWASVPPIEEWFETNPGDNLPASVGCRARLAYDSEFLYAAFEFDDPDPNAIRAPLGDRDNLAGSTDYGGIILDARNDGKTAQMFLANARGILYDAITSDSRVRQLAGFFWTRRTRHPRGWQMECESRFLAIRYNSTNP